MHPALILGGLGGFVALLMMGSNASATPATTTTSAPSVPAPVNPVIRNQAAQVLKQAEAAQAVLNSTSDGWPDNFASLSPEERAAAVERARQSIANIKAIWYPDTQAEEAALNPAVVAARDGSVAAAQTVINAAKSALSMFDWS